MNLPTSHWLHQARDQHPEARRRRHAQMAHHLDNLIMSGPQRVVLHHHYFREALGYVLTHNSDISGLSLQVAGTDWIEHAPFGTVPGRVLTPWQRVELSRLCQNAQATQAPVNPGALDALGLAPADFGVLLSLQPSQRRWSDLIAVQLRHLDPLGFWQVVVRLRAPRGDLELALTYRDAEAHGLTLDLLAPQEGTEAWEPYKLPLSAAQMQVETGLDLSCWPAPFRMGT